MSSKTPWDDIGIPNADFNVRKVLNTGSIPVFWGKNVNGDCLLIVELEGDHGALFRKNGTTVFGIGVDLRNSDESQRQNLILTLEKHVDRDLFLGLCQTLIASLTPANESHVALAVTLAHIKRWKAFLAGKRAKLLSPEELRGLFAELLFLRSLYTRGLSQIEAIHAWYGTDGAHQDFIFGDTAVEVKSLSGRERNAVRISSEDQLESLSDNLYLMVYKLTELLDSDRSLSLNDIVLAIERELTDAEALENFSQKLSAFGYIPLAEYDTPRFQATSSICYRITEHFPRLVRSLIPQGIARLSYDIKLESIAIFECDATKILARN